ncbi:MAG: 2'-5' RNA ligase family protein [Patescibacteria group bacterium]|nr:2'-5' RNA ligase family protein [Patescibacteria group bacterium]
MEQYAIVYFPKINLEKINAFRENYDPHWNIIPPHITLVSPFSDIPEDQIFKHLKKVTEDLKPFQIHLHGLLKTDDHLLFLRVKEGRDEIINVHNKLYSGILSFLEQKYIFDPHMTLGKISAKDNLEDIAYTTAEAMNLDIHSTFDNISLIKGDGVSPAKKVKVFNLK